MRLWTLLACLALFEGALRAQVICLAAELEGVNELPPNASSGKGTAWFLLDPVADTVTYELTFDNLSAPETVCQIHGYAAPGAGAGTLHLLPAGHHKTGVWFYPPADEPLILAGLTYVNVHSTAFMKGEIRGQIERVDANAVLLSTLDGPQAGTGSPAFASGVFAVDTAANRVDYHLTLAAGLLLGGETAAHLHGMAAPGSCAGVLHPLPGGFHKRGTWIYAESEESGILADLTYTNVHSSAFPNGELRGQNRVVCTCEPGFVSYCTAGASASGCVASLSASGFPSASAISGFVLTATGVEGQKDGLFFFGANGRQANPWGNGTSFQCVVPPVKRGGVQAGTGSTGACDGAFPQDLNTRWQAKPGQNPGAGAVVQAQLWYRDPSSTSNQTTSLSNALEFTVCP